MLLRSFWRLLRKARKPGALQAGDLLAHQLLDPADQIMGKGENGEEFMGLVFIFCVYWIKDLKRLCSMDFLKIAMSGMSIFIKIACTADIYL